MDILYLLIPLSLVLVFVIAALVLVVVEAAGNTKTWTDRATGS
jgi:hypothetical protein